MREITSRMLAQKEQEERLALEAKKPTGEAIEATGDTEVPEALELVEPPPAPDDFNRGRGR